MWEFEYHDWNGLQGFRSSKNVRLLLDRVLRSTDEKEWQTALNLVEIYASDLGVPSEATKDVVACLVAVAVRAQGQKRSAILGTLEELTCGRGVDEYTPQEVEWLRSSVHELAYALHTWAHLAESASIEDAVLAVDLLAYCAVYIPQVESKVLRYLQLCAVERPELAEEISALLANSEDVRRLLEKGSP